MANLYKWDNTFNSMDPDKLVEVLSVGLKILEEKKDAFFETEDEEIKEKERLVGTALRASLNNIGGKKLKEKYRSAMDTYSSLTQDQKNSLADQLYEQIEDYARKCKKEELKKQKQIATEKIKNICKTEGHDYPDEYIEKTEHITHTMKYARPGDPSSWVETRQTWTRICKRCGYHDVRNIKPEEVRNKEVDAEVEALNAKIKALEASKSKPKKEDN